MNKYIRQEVLEEIGPVGQKIISLASVAVIGVGALGTTTSELLVRAGVGKILLVDKDIVEEVNLQRQVLFDENDVGKKKVLVAKEKLNKINSEVDVEVKEDFLSDENISVLDGYKLILDCTDNMNARHTINDYCEKENKTWIHSAVVGTTGNILVIKNKKEYGKFRIVFGSSESFDSCAQIGVIGPVCSMISSIQVSEALKIILGKEPCIDLIRVNIWDNSYEKIKF